MELLSEKDALNWILYVIYFGFPILIAINLGVLITLIQLKRRIKLLILRKKAILLLEVKHPFVI